MALISFNRVHLAYGHFPLLDHADFALEKGERVGLIGRNGTGKSSMLAILANRVQPDDGEVVRAGQLIVAEVNQEPDLSGYDTVHAAVLNELEFPLDHDDPDSWRRPAQAQALIERLKLAPDLPISALSGGMRKRVALAQALAQEPDILLLDEPTNHLDFAGIAWLEEVLLGFNGSVVVITHDRRFLDVVATRIVELDRGKLASFPGNFSTYQERKAEMLAAEALEQARFDKLLAQEEVWIRKGVEARRTRNEGRVRRLEALRNTRQERRERQGNVQLSLDSGQRSGKLVAELENVSKAYGERVLIRDYSTTILRGDRIGVIGPNGAGKTTLLKIILGELAPDAGDVRLGTQLQVAYFDQMRSQLDDNAALVDVINPGSEWVEIGNQRKHVMSYLGDFLFPPQRAHSPVSSLSGGERARLLLARLFARPANVLVLDEPTNDLDIETLELLEDLLQEYPGTVFLVSHDRVFLNNVVSSVIACDGNGVWRDYVGGYDEWVAQRPADVALEEEAPARSTKPARSEKPKVEAQNDGSRNTAKPKASRLTSWELKELEGLPAILEKLETTQAELTEQMSDPDLYRDGPEKAAELQARIDEMEIEMMSKLERWEELEAKRPTE